MKSKSLPLTPRQAYSALGNVRGRICPDDLRDLAEVLGSTGLALAISSMRDMLDRQSKIELERVHAELKLRDYIAALPHQRQREEAERLMLYFGKLCQDLDAKARAVHGG